MAMVLSVLTLSHSIIEVSSCGRPCSIEYCNDSCANDGDRNDDDCSKVVCMGGSLGNCDGCGSSTCSIFFASILEDENNSFECGSPIKDVIDDEKAFSPSTLVLTASTLPPTLDLVDSNSNSSSCESLCPEVEPPSWVVGSCDAQAFLGCPVCRYSDSYCFFDCVDDGNGDGNGGMWAEACEGSYQGVPEPRLEVPTPDPTVTLTAVPTVSTLSPSGTGNPSTIVPTSLTAVPTEPTQVPTEGSESPTASSATPTISTIDMTFTTMPTVAASSAAPTISPIATPTMPPSENEFVLDAITSVPSSLFLDATTAVPTAAPTIVPTAAPTSTVYVSIPQNETNTEPLVMDSKPEVLTNAEKSEITDRSPTSTPSFAPSPLAERLFCEAVCPEVEPILYVKDSCDAQNFLENGCPACQYSDLSCFFNCVADGGDGGVDDAGVGMWSGVCEASVQPNEVDPESAGSRRRIRFWAAIGLCMYGMGRL